MPRWLWFALAASALLLWLAMRGGPGTPVAAVAVDGEAPVRCVLPPGYVRDDNPRQSPAGGMGPFRLGQAQVTPLAGFSLEARVLSREDYSSGPEAEFSPTDLALGWGPMAGEGMAERLDVSQGGRWYRYRWGAEGPPLPPEQIVRNSANMHLIPADATVARALADVHEGEVVRLDGWLVRIDRPDGWHWQSSTTREDSGGGSCELVYVCKLQATGR
jgi:hypothetical protein